MLSTDIPGAFPIPFANSAGAGYIRSIPEASQIGITDGAASLTDGFPPLNFTPVSSGGVPPFGQDYNGLLNQITAGLRWLQAGGLPVFSATYAAAIGGYPKGAMLARATMDGFWVSIADSNTNNPDTGGANWWALSPGWRISSAGVFGTDYVENAYYDTGSSSWKFRVTGSASRMHLDGGSGTVNFYTATGTAGAAVTWTSTIQINADGSVKSYRAAASGYTRISPNYCATIGESATGFTVNTTVARPASSGAKALCLQIEVSLISQNAIGARTGVAAVYSDSVHLDLAGACTANAYEFAAVASQTLTTNTATIICPVDASGNVYLTIAGAASGRYMIMGYFD